jgi:hypothetical protein
MFPNGFQEFSGQSAKPPARWIRHAIKKPKHERTTTMIKLNAGVSRKVGEPNYGSRGASVNVELELESTVVNDTDALHEKIRRLFALAKKSVDEELGISTSAANNGGANASSNGETRAATDKQKHAIAAICVENGLDGDQEALDMFDRPAIQLTLPEASQLIDRLKTLRNNRTTQYEHKT